MIGDRAGIVGGIGGRIGREESGIGVGDRERGYRVGMRDRCWG